MMLGEMNRSKETQAASSVRYCGRIFTPTELETIRRIAADTEKHPTRSAISRAVCRTLGWVKPNGQEKDVSCRVALLRMHETGLICLPPSTRASPRFQRPSFTPATGRQTRIEGSRRDLGPLRLQLITAKHPQSALWNELIARYHPLGYAPLVGAQARYLVYDERERLLAAFGFGASAWRVAPRDRFIGWNDRQRQTHLHLIVNNARFLLPPWVRVRYLASSLLAQVARQFPDDWEQRYHYRPVLLETFIDERFRGCCYQAANWIHVGQTQGLGKKSRAPRKRGLRKEIFVFPLQPDFRQILCPGGGTHERRSD